MRQGSSSYTAVWVTFLRAIATNAHLGTIFDDPIAESFLPARLRRASRRVYVQRGLARLAQRRRTSGFAEILLRARYCEDQLTQAVAEGRAAQYVILGAGWDSFAVRRTDLLPRLRVFELDHPATQQSKRARLEQLGFRLPVQVTLVPIDFERQAINERLLAHGFDPDLPTFVNWLGVTYYLTEPVIDAVFQTLARLCHNDLEVVFDYADKVRKGGPGTPLYWRIRRRFMHYLGEPFHTALLPESLPSRFAALGYELVANFVGKQQAQIVTPGEMGPFQAGGHLHIAHVRRPKALLESASIPVS